MDADRTPAAAPGSEWTPAECDVHPGEIEYGDSGCAKCREESAARASELPTLPKVCPNCGDSGLFYEPYLAEWVPCRVCCPEEWEARRV